MKLFIWDLHGTLEQGNEIAAVEVSNKILESFGYSQRFDELTGKKLYGLKWYEYYEYLLPDETHERHIELQEASFALSNSPEGATIIAKHIKPSLHALLILGAIKLKHDQIVVSNTVPESLPFYLNVLGITNYFGKNNALAVNQHSKEATRTKADVIKDYLIGKIYDEIIVIGDSEGDMLLADQISAKAYLYAHGGTPFRSKKGHYKINDLSELLIEL